MGRIGLGALERLDLGLFVDREDDGVVRRVEVEPDDIADFLDEQRVIGRALKVRTMWGWSPNVRQMRPTVVWLIPAASAILRVLQCVSALRLLSSVLTITRSTASSEIVRGAPGRGSSYSAATRPATKRRRHLPTVVPVVRSFAATTVVRRAGGAAEHDLRAQREMPVRAGAPRQAVEFGALGVGDSQRRFGPSSSSHRAS